jgi:hypothetical protein
MLVGLLAAGALVAAACGSSGGSSASGHTGALQGSSRFVSQSEFCTPSKSQPSKPAQSIDQGITSSQIVITDAELDTATLLKAGFSYDDGNTRDQAATFVNIINQDCGGIWGRQLKLESVTEPVQGLAANFDVVDQQNCIKITQDEDSVVAFSNTGVGDPLASCLTGPHNTIFLGTYNFTANDFAQSQGRLYSFDYGDQMILSLAARQLAPQLQGKRIAVITDDNPGDAQTTQQGLIQTLNTLGIHPAAFDVIKCNNTEPCTGGLIQYVQGMKADHIQAVFPLLDTISLPGFIQEMVSQGFKPGQVQFYNTSFQAQDSELVASKIVQFGSKAAARLYNGAVIVSGASEGEWRLPGYKPDAFETMCNNEYIAHSAVQHQSFNPYTDDGNRKYNSVAGNCGDVRTLARAIEAAGPNPTRAAIAAAMGSLGPVEGPEGPGTFTLGKPVGPNDIIVMKFEYPCQLHTDNAEGNCIEPTTPFLPAPKG